MKKHIQGRKIAYNVFIHALLIIFLVVALFPIYWMLNTSFKTDAELYRRIPTFFPKNPSIAGYVRLFDRTAFLQGLINSIKYALTVSLITIFFCMLAAYSIARLKFKGSRIMSRSVLYAYLMPRTLMFIPMYLLAAGLGILNTRLALIIIYPTFTIPYALWMLIAYFRTVPVEIEESAIIDGCGPWRLMFSVFFPLVIPGIVSTFIFCFTLCWNEYLYALLMVTDSTLKTFPLILSDLMVDDLYAWGALMAGSVISCVPILLMYSILSSRLTSGLTVGSVKG